VQTGASATHSVVPRVTLQLVRRNRDGGHAASSTRAGRNHSVVIAKLNRGLPQNRREVPTPSRSGNESDGLERLSIAAPDSIVTSLGYSDEALRLELRADTLRRSGAVGSIP
jgi:hypothetical protein